MKTDRIKLKKKAKRQSPEEVERNLRTAVILHGLEFGARETASCLNDYFWRLLDGDLGRVLKAVKEEGMPHEG
jgi:hypothetical protein